MDCVAGAHARWNDRGLQKMKLIVVAGLPGTGKSALAEAIGRELWYPVFAKDWLEATLLRCNLIPINAEKSLGFAGYELLTVLAERQLSLEQSVIMDSVVSTESIRTCWRDLASKYSADLRVIECICSNEAVHRERLNHRQRRIPGWQELEWPDVERVRSYYAAWRGERLVLDAINPFDENLSSALEYCCK